LLWLSKTKFWIFNVICLGICCSVIPLYVCIRDTFLCSHIDFEISEIMVDIVNRMWRKKCTPPIVMPILTKNMAGDYLILIGITGMIFPNQSNKATNNRTNCILCPITNDRKEIIMDYLKRLDLRSWNIAIQYYHRLSSTLFDYDICKHIVTLKGNALFASSPLKAYNRNSLV
jgi:hypothetical protein